MPHAVGKAQPVAKGGAWAQPGVFSCVTSCAFPDASRFPLWNVRAFQSCEGKNETMCVRHLAECLAHNQLSKCQLHLFRVSRAWRHYLSLLLIVELYTRCLWDCRV